MLCFLIAFPLSAQKKKSNYEPLFGKRYAAYGKTSNSLKGAVFYLVSGHGGPDPGCIGKYRGKELHEDEYAYDIILRLGRELLRRGAKVHFIIQDAKDGIRNQAILNNSKRETCMGKAIPLNQVARLQQRCDAINRTVVLGETRPMCSSIMRREVPRESGWPGKYSVRSGANTTVTSLTGDLTAR